MRLDFLSAPQPQLHGEGHASTSRCASVHPRRALPHCVRGQRRTMRSPARSRQVPLPSHRRRVRRLQPVRERLARGELHHHGALADRRRRSAHRTQGGRLRQLDHSSEQSGEPARQLGCAGGRVAGDRSEPAQPPAISSVARGRGAAYGDKLLDAPPVTRGTRPAPLAGFSDLAASLASVRKWSGSLRFCSSR